MNSILNSIAIAGLLVSFALTGNGSPLIAANEMDQTGQHLTRQSTGVALDFHRRLAAGHTNENVVLSPFSITALLAMATAGARDRTRVELNRLLAGAENLSDEDLLRSYTQLVQHAIKDNDKVLSTANMMYPASDCRVRDEFKQVIRDTFAGKIDAVDFAFPATKDRINGDVSQATHGKIPQLFDSLDPSTRMVLVNAIYFKGKWVTKFKEADTKQEDFYENAERTNSVGKVPLMYYKSKVDYAHSSALRAAAVRLPYQDSNTAMIVLLPDRGVTLADLEKKLTTEQLDTLTRSFWKQSVKLWLPRFKIESTHSSLVDTIKEMGVEDMFGRRANFSGITTSERLYASEIIQKATIEVNEEGTEAAAATGMTMRSMAIGGPPPPQDIIFRADRPFMYMIVSEISLEGSSNQKASIPLFSGRFVRP